MFIKTNFPVFINDIILLTSTVDLYFSRKQLYLIYLGHNCIQHFTFEWSKHNGFVFDRINYKALSWLYDSSSYVVYCCNRDNEAISE